MRLRHTLFRTRQISACFLAISLASTISAQATVPAAITGDAPAPPERASWLWPTSSHSVLNAFVAPQTTYSSGHRGIDISSEVEEAVVAPDSGTVTFSGSVAGRSVLVIDHGGVRSTLEPIASTLAQGDAVVRGQVVGEVESDGFHCPTACVHLGARIGEEYVSPMLYLGVEYSILLPLPR